MQTQSSDLNKIYEVMQSLAINSSAADFDDFIRISVKNLALLYGCKFAFVGELQPCKKKVRTLAVWAGNEFAENFEYELEGTPCQDVLEHKKQLIPRDASKIYSTDKMLVDMGIDSYFGAPLIAKDQQVTGIVSVMNTEPLQPDELTEPVLGAYSTRLSVELESKHNEEQLALYRDKLEALVNKRTLQLELAHKDLVRQERLATLGQLIATVSHELRNPLGTIRSSVYTVSQNLASKDKATDKVLERIQRNISRADNIINELLDFTRTKEPNFKKHDFIAWLEKCINELEIPDNIKLDVKLEGDCHIKFDENLMHRVLLNLFDNACQAMESGGKLSIETRISPDRLIFIIADTGCGIEAEIMNYIFEPLYSTKGFGVGMGLFIVNRVIKQHNGEITINSQPGEGTQIEVDLPRSQ